MTLNFRDESILGLIARARNEKAARSLLGEGLAPEAYQAAQVLLGDISAKDAGEEARAYAEHARARAKARSDKRS